MQLLITALEPGLCAAGPVASVDVMLVLVLAGDVAVDRNRSLTLSGCLKVIDGGVQHCSGSSPFLSSTYVCVGVGVGVTLDSA